MPTAPAVASTAPRAWPTANAVLTLRPKKMSSTASAAGRCAAMSSSRHEEIAASRRSSGSPALVEITPPPSDTSAAPRRSTTPNPVEAVPGSMPSTTEPRSDVRAGRGETLMRVVFFVRDLIPTDRKGAPPLTLLHAAEPEPHEGHHHRDQLGHVGVAIAKPPVAERVEAAHNHFGELL